MDAQDQCGWTSCHYASWGGYVKCLKLLVQNGADRSILDNKKRRAIDIARYQEYYGIFIHIFADMILHILDRGHYLTHFDYIIFTLFLLLSLFPSFHSQTKSTVDACGSA